MPDKDYELVLDGALDNPTDLLRVRIVTDRGEVVDFIAQFETIIEGQHYPVVRYDGSHGRGHRDLLNRRGETVDKDWLAEHLTLGQALTFGVKDITANWPLYRDAFLTRERFD